MNYFGKTLKGTVLIWLLREHKGDLVQLYAENTQLTSLIYGLQCIIDNYGSVTLQQISDKDLKCIAYDIKRLYASPYWDNLVKIKFY